MVDLSKVDNFRIIIPFFCDQETLDFFMTFDKAKEFFFPKIYWRIVYVLSLYRLEVSNTHPCRILMQLMSNKHQSEGIRHVLIVL